MEKIIARITHPIAAALLLGACASASSPPRADADAQVRDAFPPQAARLAEVADRLQAEYEGGARPYPTMAADPRDAVSPETLRMMMATADRLSGQYATDVR